MNSKHQFLFIFLWLIAIAIPAQDSLFLITEKKDFYAGDTISLSFKNKSNTSSYQLFCTNSYGSTLITPDKNEDILIFNIPQFISNKTGILHWKLIGNNQNISGKLSITSYRKPTSLETYIGPPTIEAGGIDYAMIIVIPTDSLDNPIPENSKVDVKRQFLQSENKQTILTKDLIGYLNIFSPTPSGRMLISTESYELNSKEYTLDILPAIGKNFKVFHERDHKYADGNQITTLYTSIIRDKNNNVVSDGTFVDFFITNQDGNILNTSGTTIRGIATASIIHPDCEATWNIKAFIDGIANSDVLQISYAKVIHKIPVKFSEDNRIITVGPLISFMEQMIPDGLQIELSMYKEGKFLNKIVEQSKDGFTTFKINPNIYKSGNYEIQITSACNTKIYKSIKLW
ncbi:Ig-like domain-containing protein [Tenacibaculum agarivorans]|uniref:Ig-like domain-containing protein n=1 Tax=Tenacibaculum agarivorans TaxID=1908389 RepID=UPI00094BBCBF|nr:Ig-like domain-containing protein [Tenacibaculum agarivorans]